VLKQSNSLPGCSWIVKNSSKDFEDNQIYPNNVCPLLYYSSYPYMLGLLFGADFMHNKEGDANVSCPAMNGVRAYARKRDVKDIPPELKNDKISKDSKFIIYIDIVNVGKCPNNHKVNEKFMFPTSMKKHYLCPASWFNAFPFLAKKFTDLECLDEKKVKCPDWDREDMALDVSKEIWKKIYN